MSTPVKNFSKKLGNICLTLLLCLSFQMAKGDVKLDFMGAVNAEFSYPVIVTGTVKATVNGSNTSTLTPTSNKLWIPKGATEAIISFDRPEAVVSLDFRWRTQLGLGCMLVGIEIDGLEALQSLYLDNNALTWPLTGGIADGCTVDYGRQQTVIFPVLRDNRVDLSAYNFTDWTARWVYAANEATVDPSYYTAEPDGFTRFRQNLSENVKVYLEHTSGFVLESQGMRFNKIMSPLFSFVTDGRGTATSVNFQSNRPVTQTMVAECEEDYVENDIWKISLNVPSILDKAKEVTVKVNIPEVVSAIYLNDLGITSLDFPVELPYLNEIELRGNSLLPSAIPVQVFGCANKKIGEQQSFALTTAPGNFSFDLSKELEAGAKIEWIDADGQTVSPDNYTENNGIYTFIGNAGIVKARITHPSLPDYSITSEPVNVEMQFAAVAEFSWTDDSSTPPIICVTTSAPVQLMLNSEIYSLTEATTAYLRLGASSGNAILMATNPGNIVGLDFSGIGIKKLTLSENIPSLTTLNVEDNRFTPYSLPVNIPAGCRVIWGEMPIVDITPFVNSDANSADLYDYSRFEISWFYYPSGEEVDPIKYTERAGYYVFENVGEVYAVISVPGYDGLEFYTNVVDFSSEYFEIMTFESKGAPVGTFTLSGTAKFRVNGKDNGTAVTDGVVIDFTNGTAATATYVVTANFPENITRIDLSSSGITKISLGNALTSLESLDLSGNAMTFKTFPLVEGIDVVLENQEPVEVVFDSDKGVVMFDDFAECNDISVIDADGEPLSTDVYELKSTNDALTFKSTVIDVAIKFAGHPLFPDVHLLSTPLSFVAESSLYEIADDDWTIKIGDGKVEAPVNIGITIYSTAGVVIARVGAGQSITLEKGVYIAVAGSRAVKFIL